MGRRDAGCRARCVPRMRCVNDDGLNVPRYSRVKRRRAPVLAAPTGLAARPWGPGRRGDRETLALPQLSGSIRRVLLPAWLPSPWSPGLVPSLPAVSAAGTGIGDGRKRGSATRMRRWMTRRIRTTSRPPCGTRCVSCRPDCSGEGHSELLLRQVYHLRLPTGVWGALLPHSLDGRLEPGAGRLPDVQEHVDPGLPHRTAHSNVLRESVHSPGEKRR